MNNIVVVSSKAQQEILSSVSSYGLIMTAEEYLKLDVTAFDKKTRVYNLCNDYSYCKRGYYVSLLAEARGHRPFPNVATISDFQNEDAVKFISTNVARKLAKELKEIKTDKFEISIYFGKNTAQKYSSIAKTVFSALNVPMVRIYCERIKKEWRIRSIHPISFKDVPKLHYEFLKESMVEFFGLNRIPNLKQKHYRYDLAILFNEDEEIPPSDKKAIEHFIKAAKDLRINAQVIGPKDISMLNRFDALFIRETTNVFDHTYQFAKKAELEGLVVIDDPKSILRCCNKVFLHDYMMRRNINAPKTKIIYKDSDLSYFQHYPLIIKKPDSAFSAGVKKVDNLEELIHRSNEYFQKSDLLILQEFLKTDFDWRIGIIDGKPLYACRYYMAKEHWQIISREGDKTTEGESDTIPIEEVPPKAIKLALAACKDIGNSLYGVDIKEKDGEFFLIEINDNPSIEAGVEDAILGPKLYTEIMATFLRRLEAK